MARLVALGLALLLSLSSARAAANEDEAPPPDPCACCCKPHANGWHSRRAAAIMGLTLLGSGYALTMVHSLGQPDLRAKTELIPLAGPFVALAHDDSNPTWTTLMTFAGWSQAMGVLVLAIALSGW